MQKLQALANWQLQAELGHSRSAARVAAATTSGHSKGGGVGAGKVLTGCARFD
jgi:hypothetical protein